MSKKNFLIENLIEKINGEEEPSPQEISLALTNSTDSKTAKQLHHFISALLVKKEVEATDRLARTDAILDTMLDALIVISDKGIVQSANKATEKIFGYTADELIGQNIKVLMPDPFQSEHDGYLAKYKKSGVKKIIGLGREVPARRKDGSIFDAYLSISELQLNNKKLFTGILKDISAQKAAEEEEEEVARRNKELEEINWQKTQFTDISEICTSTEDITEMSKKLLSHFGKKFETGHGAFYTRELNSKGEFKNSLRLQATYAMQSRKNLNTIIAFEEGIIGQCAYEKSAIILTNVPSNYIKITSSLGESLPLNIIAQPLIMDNSVFGVIELASFTPFNDRFIDLMGNLAETVAIAVNRITSSQRTQILLEESQILAKQLKEQQQELEESNNELKQQTSRLENSEKELKEQQQELERSNSDLEEQSERPIQEKKKTEDVAKIVEKAKKELEIKAQQLQESSRYKSEFLANMSHELRTPLNSLLLLSRKLQDNDQKTLTKDQVEMAQCIHSGGKDLLHLINDILDLSKVEAGMLDINKEDINIEELVISVTQKLSPQLNDKKLKLQLKIQGNLPAIHTDPQRAEQILKNLLSNAIKFTKEGSITVYAKSSPDSQHLAISIKDTGIGIPKDKQVAIFEAFKQIDGSTSRQYTGTGLGLSICKQLIKLLNGKINVESTPGQGSTFTFHLPIQPHRTKSAPESFENIDLSSSQKSSKPAAMSTNLKCILIAEENINIIESVCKYAEEQGYETIIVNTCEEAINCYNQTPLEGMFLKSQWYEQFELGTKNNTLNEGTPKHLIKRDKSRDSTVASFEQALNQLKKLNKKAPKNVLIAEDDPQVMKHLKEILTTESIKATTVASGSDALDILEKNDQDCFVLDYQLTDMTAIDLLKQAHLSKTIILPPVIINTSRELTRDEIRIIHHYTNTIIIKGPYSNERLFQEIKDFLAAPHQVSYSENEDDDVDEGTGLEGTHILIADDDFKNTLALSTVLKKYVLNISIADNGQSAFDILNANSDIGLVIMDVMMPVKDGYTTIKEMRENTDYKDIPIIALSASAMPEVKSKCIEVGANDFMAKPVDIDNLVPVLKSWLRNG